VCDPTPWVGCPDHARGSKLGVMDRKAGWHPDSDRLAERYWNGAAWEGFRVRNRGPGFVVTVLIRVYIPIATVWIATSGGDFNRPSVGMRVASVVVGVLALVLIGRALTQAITITRTAVTTRGILRTHRYRLEQIEDAFLRETGFGNAWLTLQLRDEKLVALGNLDDRPERQRACVAEIRHLLFDARSGTAAPGSYGG
jgi:PH (Pleckstrin Homology) domain-containing protein